MPPATTSSTKGQSYSARSALLLLSKNVSGRGAFVCVALAGHRLKLVGDGRGRKESMMVKALFKAKRTEL